jgi:murein DD-endopeptidase MepM/ murein hydrolase activator NlpD
MNKNRRRKEYSTLMIVNKNNPSTKSFSIQTKHLARLKYYVLSLAILLVALIISIFVLSSKYKQNEHAKKELERFKKEIAGPLATDTNIARIYIKKIDHQLVKIKKYLQQRGIKHSFNLGGSSSEKQKAIDSYKYYNVYLAALLKDIKYMPLGYPHFNHNNSRYGYRSNPFHGGGSEFHSGVDISGDTGDPIKSTANGTVFLADWSSGYGKCIRIKHSHGYETLYGHLSEINVKNGQKVKANQEIGKLGSTGRSTGPHLHYEVRYMGRPINPTKFLDL